MGSKAKVCLVLILLLGGGAGWYFIWGPGNAHISPWTKGENYYTIGSYQRALDAYLEALTQNPDHEEAGEATYRVARCMQLLERHDEALNVYQEYVRKYPNHRRVSEAQTQIAQYKFEEM